MTIASRLRNLRQKLAELKVDAILIGSPYNRYYLSGFDGSAGYLLITTEKAVLATDFRYVEQAGREAPAYSIIKIGGEIGDWLPRLAAELHFERLAFEAQQVTYAFHKQLNEIIAKPGINLTLEPVSGLVESLRAVKEHEEIELITRAVAIADAAQSHIRSAIKIGMTELAAAWEIEKFMREEGSQTMPFDIIVCSGPNSALPHAKPSSRAIGPGEPVVIDIGARVDDYTSDLTRTVCLGEPTDTFNRLYDIVLKAQTAAITGIKENMAGDEADRLARSVIEQAGHGDAFGHGLGHGIGLETHELPRIGLKSSDQLTNSMVFTVEPGIYLSGWGGIRIEDDVIMENGKARVISRASK